MCAVLKTFGCFRYLPSSPLPSLARARCKNTVRQAFAKGELSHGETECHIFKVSVCLYTSQSWRLEEVGRK